MNTLKTYIRSPWVGLVVFTATCLLLYGHILSAPFQFDDMDFIVENSTIKQLSNVKAIWDNGALPVRFVGFLSFALNYHFHRLEVEGYHLINCLIHILNAFVLWRLIRMTLQSPSLKLKRDKSWLEEAAFFGALLFLVHPIQTQAVSYISQRFASLATLFYLSSLYFYAKARFDLKHKGVFCVFCIFCGALGMLTKQIVFTLPLVIFLYDRYFCPARAVKEKEIPWFYGALLLGMLLFLPLMYGMDIKGIIGRSMVSHSHAQSAEVITSGKYLLTQFCVLIKYIQLLFFPISQNLDYDYALSQNLFEGKTFLSFLSLVFLSVAGVVSRKKYPLFSFCTIYFFITLLVESSIIPIPHVIFEHRLYLPSVGFCFFIPVFFLSLMKNKQKWRVALCIIICSFSLMTFWRNFVWQTPFALWSDVAKKSPNKDRPYNNLGLSLMQENRVEEAFVQFQIAIKKNPNYAKAHSGLGNIYRTQGNLKEAFAHFNYAVMLSPKTAKYWNNRAVILKAQKKYQEAFNDFQQALRLDAHNIEALNNLGNLYRSQRNGAAAIELYNKAINIFPDFPETYNNRGLLYKNQKEYQLALKDYNKVLALKKDHVAALNNRGLIFKEQKLYDKALSDFNEALGIDLKQPKLYNNRGFVYEKKQMFDLALKDYNQAIELNPEYALAYSNRGFVYLQKKRVAQALKDFNKALSIGGEEAKSYYHRSLAYYTLENYDQAWHDLEKAQAFGLSPPNDYLIQLQSKREQRE